MSASHSASSTASRSGIAAVLALGAGVAVAIGVYSKAHSPAGRPLFTLGFSGMLQMKVWLATAATSLLVVQLLTAMWMWGRLPHAGSAPSWVSPIHRWSGSIAFTLTLPVAFHCMWALGFADTSARVLIHSLAGCVFYGAYASKMLGLRVKGLPGWTLPVLGGSVLATLVLIWLTAALWFFTRSGVPLV